MSRVETGDWVAFLRDARVVIGRVEYVRRNERWPHDIEAVTTSGVTRVVDVLEVRAAAKEP